MQPPPHGEIETDAAEDQRQVNRIPPGIEEKRRSDQHSDSQARAPPEQEERAQRQRQEVDQVFVAVEEHRVSVRSTSSEIEHGKTSAGKCFEAVRPELVEGRA